MLELLQNRIGLDLWAVTRVHDGVQEVLTARSTGFPIPPGAVLPWAESYCRRMVEGRGPRIAPRAQQVPAYMEAEVNARIRVGAYVGVPLKDEDGQLFGTVCGIAAAEQPEELTEQLPLVELLAGLLSTILVKEQLAATCSAAAAEAYALAERDPLTGLLNPRGYERALATEEQRRTRTRHCSTVLLVDLDGLEDVNRRDGHAAGDDLLRRAGRLLRALCRPADAVARLCGDDFAVLAVDTAPGGARALAQRLQAELAEAGLPASVGAADTGTSGTLDSARKAAEAELARHKRVRGFPAPAHPAPVRQDGPALSVRVHQQDDVAHVHLSGRFERREDVARLPRLLEDELDLGGVQTVEVHASSLVGWSVAGQLALLRSISRLRRRRVLVTVRGLHPAATAQARGSGLLYQLPLADAPLQLPEPIGPASPSGPEQD